MGFRDYLDLELYESKPTGTDSQIRYNCPFCPPNDDYKLYLNVSGGDKDGLWICFKCERKGNPVSFVMEYNGVNYPDAKDILEMYVDEDMLTSNYRELGLSDSEIMYLMLLGDEDEDDEKEELVPPPLPVGTKLIMDNLGKDEVLPFLDYIVNKRGLPPEVIQKQNIGYITNGYAVTQNNKRVTLDNHIVFFTYDDNGNYIYWNTRSIMPDAYIKSINGVSQEGEYSKRQTVFNLNVAKRTDKIVIVEGVIDALTIGDSGVATFGKQVASEQIESILAGIREDQRIYVMLDRDAPEQADKLATKLYERHKNTYIVLNPEDGDANDMGHERTWDIINNHSVSANSNKRLMLMLQEV